MNVHMERKLENLLVLKNLIGLMKHDLTKKNIYEIQNKKLKKLMQRANEIPIYQKKFEECGMKPADFKCRKDLVKFPVLTKKEIKEWILPELKKNPKKYAHYHIYTTSGSTGNPLTLCASPKENAIFTANWLRIAMENGINPFCDKTMALKDPSIVAQGRESFLQKFGILRRYKVSFLSEGEVIAKEINRIQPQFLYAHRTKLTQTIDFAKKNNMTLYHPKAYASISETLTDQSIQLFQEFLGNNLFTSYGSMETGACTFTKLGDIKNHIVTNDTHIINIVNEQNQLCHKGRMVITNLFLSEFPIINYDIGDGAETIDNNGVEYLTEIKGRLNDWIVLEDGRKYDYHPFYAATEKIEEIIHFRVIQETYHDIILEIVPTSFINLDRYSIEKKIIYVLRSTIKDYEMNYQFVWKEKIEADVNGKSRFIVNKIS